MLRKREARILVEAELRKASPFVEQGDSGELVILDEHTVERDWGWVFFYQSAQYVRT